MEEEKRIDPNQFMTIYHWMSLELGLKGTQKELYAIVYGFSENDGWCYLSTKKLAKIIGVCPDRINKGFTALRERGLLVRELFDKYGCKITYKYQTVRKNTENEVAENADMPWDANISNLRRHRV